MFNFTTVVFDGTSPTFYNNMYNRHGRPLFSSLIFHYPELHKVNIYKLRAAYRPVKLLTDSSWPLAKCSVNLSVAPATSTEQQLATSEVQCERCRWLQQPQPTFQPPPHETLFCT